MQIAVLTMKVQLAHTHARTHTHKGNSPKLKKRKKKPPTCWSWFLTICCCKRDREDREHWIKTCLFFLTSLTQVRRFSLSTNIFCASPPPKIRGAQRTGGQTHPLLLLTASCWRKVARLLRRSRTCRCFVSPITNLSPCWVVDKELRLLLYIKHTCLLFFSRWVPMSHFN